MSAADDESVKLGFARAARGSGHRRPRSGRNVARAQSPKYLNDTLNQIRDAGRPAVVDALFDETDRALRIDAEQRPTDRDLGIVDHALVDVEIGLQPGDRRAQLRIVEPVARTTAWPP